MKSVMLIKRCFSTLLILLVPTALGHLHPRDSNGTLAGQVIGNDPPQPPSTYGYSVNHVGLQVSNITKTREFWGDVLGLRFIFSFSIANTATQGSNLVTYMGYPFGDGKVGNQTGAELLANLHSRDGLIEFISTNPTVGETIQSEIRGFSHICIVVPNITATQERFESYNVNILKHVGQQAGDNIDVIFGLEKGGQNDFPTVFNELFDGYMMVTDPDGYAVEITQAQAQAQASPAR